MVTALKFYASALKQNEHQKFMITKSVYPSDDDIDVDLVIRQKDDSNNSLTFQFMKTDDFGIFKIFLYKSIILFYILFFILVFIML